MNTIVKEAEKILSKKKRKEIKENSREFYLVNLHDFLKKYPSKIYYKNIDYLTAEIKTLNNNILSILSTFLIEYDHKRDIEKHDWLITDFKHFKILDKFYLVNLWVVFWWQKQIYWIYDINKNKIWSFIYKRPEILKKNHNVYTWIELTWLFCHFYKDYFDSILEYFWVDRKANKTLKRLDYCLDIKGIELPQLLEYLKPLYQKQRVKNYNWLLNSDKKKLLEKDSELEFWKTAIYKKFLSNSNTLIVYDKILDVVDNHMKRKIDWKNPYQAYLDSDFPIVRIELKKLSSSFSKIWDHSIDTMLWRIEADFFDYLKKYFTCDFSLLVDIKWISLNWKKWYLAKEEKQKNILHSFMMAQTYLKNIETYTSRKELFRFLLKLYPDIEKTSSLDLMDEFETYEYIRWLFPDNNKNGNK